MPNLKRALEIAPDIAPRCRFVGVHGSFSEDRSSTLFDTVAVYLACSEERLKTERTGVRVTDEGFTVRDDDASPLRAAVRWTDLEGYIDHLVGRLRGGDT